MHTRLVAETIKRWRSDPEERALGEYILSLGNISLADAHSLTVAQLTEFLENLANPVTPTEAVNSTPTEEQVEPLLEQLTQSDNQDKIVTKELPLRITELRKRGRPTK